MDNRPQENTKLPEQISAVLPPIQTGSHRLRNWLLVLGGVAIGAAVVLRNDISLPFPITFPKAPDASQTGSKEASGLARDGDSVLVPDGSPFRQRIKVEPVQQRSLLQTRTLPSIVEADPARIFNILPPLGGRITHLHVRLGDRVFVGQQLATIESGDLAQAYADTDKATATVTLTRRALERARGLSQAGGSALKDLESAQNDAAQAGAESSRAQARLKTIAGNAAISGTRELTVIAPSAGTITMLAIAQGAYINDATQSMMTVSNLDTVFVTANVPESDARLVSKGQDVEVVFPAYPGETFRSTILFVNDIMEPDTRRVKVRIGFANSDMRLKPNMFATVTLHLPQQAALAVPNAALLMNNDSTTVFVEQAPWTFIRRVVQPGYEQDGTTVIGRGLQVGERVVVRGGVLLND